MQNEGRLSSQQRLMIDLQHNVRSEIATHLLKAYPDEGCGVLVGKVGGDRRLLILRAVPMRNLHDTGTQDRFLIDPAAYCALEKKLALGSEGESVAGFYHSHPDGASRPSAVDLEMARGLYQFARTFYVYAIQSIERGRAGGLSFWRLADDLTRFEECTIS